MCRLLKTEYASGFYAGGRKRKNGFWHIFYVPGEGGTGRGDAIGVDSWHFLGWTIDVFL